MFAIRGTSRALNHQESNECSKSCGGWSKSARLLSNATTHFDAIFFYEDGNFWPFEGFAFPHLFPSLIHSASESLKSFFELWHQHHSHHLFSTRCWRSLRLLQRGLRRAARFARLHPPPLASLTNAPLTALSARPYPLPPFEFKQNFCCQKN